MGSPVYDHGIKCMFNSYHNLPLLLNLSCKKPEKNIFKIKPNNEFWIKIKYVLKTIYTHTFEKRNKIVWPIQWNFAWNNKNEHTHTYTNMSVCVYAFIRLAQWYRQPKHTQPHNQKQE
jgi:hypothetical protein